MDSLNVASDLIDELRQLLEMHCGPILCVLHILNSLQQVTNLSQTHQEGVLPSRQHSLVVLVQICICCMRA